MGDIGIGRIDALDPDGFGERQDRARQRAGSAAHVKPPTT
jgi:hypothetical protein